MSMTEIYLLFCTVVVVVVVAAQSCISFPLAHSVLVSFDLSACHKDRNDCSPLTHFVRINSLTLCLSFYDFVWARSISCFHVFISIENDFRNNAQNDMSWWVWSECDNKHLSKNAWLEGIFTFFMCVHTEQGKGGWGGGEYTTLWEQKREQWSKRKSASIKVITY